MVLAWVMAQASICGHARVSVWLSAAKWQLLLLWGCCRHPGVRAMLSGNTFG